MTTSMNITRHNLISKLQWCHNMYFEFESRCLSLKWQNISNKVFNRKQRSHLTTLGDEYYIHVKWHNWTTIIVSETFPSLLKQSNEAGEEYSFSNKSIKVSNDKTSLFSLSPLSLHPSLLISNYVKFFAWNILLFWFSGILTNVSQRRHN